MNNKQYDSLIELAEFWESIADRLENKPVAMTANTHRLFAHELRVRLSKIPRNPTIFQKIKTFLKW